jgi:tRNA threonylcarbamoyladenosine biosynthesis protein TsaB
VIVLTIRTDKPESELGIYEDDKKVAYEVWTAHRQLAETLNTKIAGLLESTGKQLADLQGIVVYKGPGSFTGLRIGISVANALAYSCKIPIAAETGAWIEQGIARLQSGQPDKLALPEYGHEAVVTAPRK